VVLAVLKAQRRALAGLAARDCDAHGFRTDDGLVRLAVLKILNLPGLSGLSVTFSHGHGGLLGIAPRIETKPAGGQQASLRVEGLVRGTRASRELERCPRLILSAGNVDAPVLATAGQRRLEAQVSWLSMDRRAHDNQREQKEAQ
jgi:hypothetical protein